jgi:hypothetical protein
VVLPYLFLFSFSASSLVVFVASPLETATFLMVFLVCGLADGVSASSPVMPTSPSSSLASTDDNHSHNGYKL